MSQADTFQTAEFSDNGSSTIDVRDRRSEAKETKKRSLLAVSLSELLATMKSERNIINFKIEATYVTIYLLKGSFYLFTEH